MYEFWYDYMKPKHNNDVKLCYMDTDVENRISLVMLKIGLILQIMK